MKKLLLSLIVVAASVSGVKATDENATSTPMPVSQDKSWAAYVSTKLNDGVEGTRGQVRLYPLTSLGLAAVCGAVFYKALEYLWNSEDEEVEDRDVEVQAATDPESLKLIGTLTDDEIRLQTTLMNQGAKNKAEDAKKKSVARKK